MTPKEEQKWKRSLPLHRYAGRLELARYRNRKLQLPPVEMSAVERLYWNETTRQGFIDFIKTDYQLILDHGLIGTCIIIHSGLVEAVKKFFSCNAVLTIGSLTTPKGELYRMDEQTVMEWKATGIDISDAVVHAWITLDSMEILDMTFLPTIADVSRKMEINLKSPIALDPDTLRNSLISYSTDVLNLPQGLKYNPFILGTEALKELGMPMVEIR